MNIIIPIQIKPENLLSTNVPIDDAPDWAPGIYPAESTVVFNFRIYESLDETSDQPDEGAVAEIPTWIDLGAINQWRMFDGVIGQRTVNAGLIDVTLSELPKVINAISLFGLTGKALHVTVTDPIDGVVYETEIALQDNSAVTDWYNYFFEAIIQREDVTLIDLPNYKNAEINLVIDSGDSDATCGEVVLGRQTTLGVTNFGTSISIQDYSRKERDQFGNISVVERRFAKLVDYDVTVETKSASNIQSILARIRAQPVVFIGDENKPETVVYGFYRGWRIGLDAPSISTATIEVEGIV